MRRVMPISMLLAIGLGTSASAGAGAAEFLPPVSVASPDIEVPQVDQGNDLLDSGFAKVDREAMTAQGHHLASVGSKAADAFGGVYFSEETGELTVRYVDGPAGRALITQLAEIAPPANGVPVRFEATARSLSHMRALASSMNASTEWAGENAGQIQAVWLDEWKYQFRIAVASHADEIAAAAKAATGFTPRVDVTTGFNLL